MRRKQIFFLIIFPLLFITSSAVLFAQPRTSKTTSPANVKKDNSVREEINPKTEPLAQALLDHTPPILSKTKDNSMASRIYERLTNIESGEQYSIGIYKPLDIPGAKINIIQDEKGNVISTKDKNGDDVVLISIDGATLRKIIAVSFASSSGVKLDDQTRQLWREALSSLARNKDQDVGIQNIIEINKGLEAVKLFKSVSQ